MNAGRRRGEPLLRVDDLSVAFGSKQVVHGVSFEVNRGETLALVGESGSGKSLTALSLLQLLPHGARNPTGRIVLAGESIIGASNATLHRARGELAGMIFQEPMTSLNPLASDRPAGGGGGAAASSAAAGAVAPSGLSSCWSRRDLPMRCSGWGRFRTSFPAGSASG